MLPDISRVEMANVETLLLDCYHARGITYENYARFIGHPEAWPTWADLLPRLAENVETQNLWAVLHSWVNGALSGMLDRPTNVNLDNQYVMLDLHDCMGDAEAKGVIFFLAMTFLWDEVNRDWSLPKILDIDELGILNDSEDALQFVWKVSKSARRRRCRLQVATQDPADFLSGRNPAALKYALGIVNNCATKVVGYLEPKALEQVAQVAKLSEAELALISSMFGKPNEKLLICGEQRAHIEIPVSLRELEILDPKAYAERVGRGEA
jgi:type IV secretory pathway VirB4 component